MSYTQWLNKTKTRNEMKSAPESIDFNRYVEGWGAPYLKIEKCVGFTAFPFHVFDRYEIQIQVFVNVIYAFCTIFRSSSSRTYIKTRYSNVQQQMVSMH